ncbi:MAG: SAM-dependent methyltransferase [Verrucomicrobiota bacterium]
MIRLWEEGESADRGRALFWPCSGEYPVYDDFLYGLMVGDRLRNRLYEQAIAASCLGKTVVEIGTGADALWALACARAGAERVFAIESDELAATRARDRVASAGLGGTVEIVKGLSTAVTLPERADICISEIIGEIGSSEGAPAVLNDARMRHLKEGAMMIPASCVTKVAGVSLPADLRSRPRFQSDGVPYVKAIFDQVGGVFDVRVAVENHVGKLRRLTDAGEYERLDFSAGLVAEVGVREVELVVTRSGRLDGLALWIELACETGGEVLDVWGYLSNWLPVYFPLFQGGIEVGAGECIRFIAETTLSDDGVHPDYTVAGSVLGESGEERASYRLESLHHGKAFRAHPFYEVLFEEASF